MGIWQRLWAAWWTRSATPLVLVNGLAEQGETWFANADHWRRSREIHMPVLAAYDGQPLHERLEAGLPIDIEFLVERLRQYLESSVNGPCDLAANSMGGKVAVELALRYPQLVRRLVLLCPSGLADQERLPIVEGVRRNDLQAVIGSVFHDRRQAHSRIVEHYQRHLQNKRWRTGLLRTIRGTMEHSVKHRLAEVVQPTLLVVGEEDQIVDPRQSLEAGRSLPNGKVVVLPGCGHAPQIERAGLINRMVVDFLSAA
jgi:abhydrolase domain-containing protein 6